MLKISETSIYVVKLIKPFKSTARLEKFEVFPLERKILIQVEIKIIKIRQSSVGQTVYYGTLKSAGKMSRGATKFFYKNQLMRVPQCKKGCPTLCWSILKIKQQLF